MRMLRLLCLCVGVTGCSVVMGLRNDYTLADAGSEAGIGSLLVGETSVGPHTGNFPNGTTQAYEFVAEASGTVRDLHVYLDPTNTCSEVIVGIYSDANEHPTKLLARGSVKVTNPTAMTGWNTTPAAPNAVITNGVPYWLAILCPTAATGSLQFRDDGVAPRPSEFDARTALGDLPQLWSSGSKTPGDGPVSIFATN